MNAEMLGMSSRVLKWRIKHGHLATNLSLPPQRIQDKGSHRELDLFPLGSPCTVPQLRVKLSAPFEKHLQ